MEGMITGRITASSGGLYTVRTPDSELYCRARGVFRHNGEKPMVGDRVEVGFEEQGGEKAAVIMTIHERKNLLIRPPLANLDYIFITASASAPAPDTLILDKLTAIAEFNHIEPVIVIGKCELDREAAARLTAVYRLAGYDTFCVSCRTGEGIELLGEYIGTRLTDSIAAFAGVSGVGKSSLMNRLFPGLEIATSAVSAKTERGRHTTRSVILYPVGGEGSGYIADTPGFSLIDFERFDFFSKEDLPGTFRELGEYLGKCRYTKCSHTKEDGCAIRAAVRDGKIAPSRHESYIALYDILKNKHAWDNK